MQLLRAAAEISANGGSVTLRALATTTEASVTTVHKEVAWLENKGFLSKWINRRGIKVTPKGLSELAR